MAKKQGKSPDNLTYKQRRFVGELPVDWNATEAAKRAGYSPNTAYNVGYKCMQNPVILEAINKELQDQQKRTQITADRALTEMAKIAFADLRRAYDENGNLKAIKDMPEDVARAVAKVKSHVNPSNDKEEQTFTKEVIFWDKTKALEQIGKHFKMFTERQEHTGKDGGPIQFENMSDEQLDRELVRYARECGLEPERLIEMGVIQGAEGESETPETPED